MPTKDVTAELPEAIAAYVKSQQHRRHGGVYCDFRG
jgi:hypothetical protein